MIEVIVIVSMMLTASIVGGALVYWLAVEITKEEQ